MFTFVIIKSVYFLNVYLQALYCRGGGGEGVRTKENVNTSKYLVGLSHPLEILYMEKCCRSCMASFNLNGLGFVGLFLDSKYLGQKNNGSGQ